MSDGDMAPVTVHHARRSPRPVGYSRGQWRAALEYALLVMLVLYIVPFTVAAHRDHPQARSILVLNLALGWTGVGWLAALAWARDYSTGPPALRALPDPVDDVARAEATKAGSPSVWWLAPAAPIALLLVMGLPDLWPHAPWWPESQAGRFDAHLEEVGGRGAHLRSGAGLDRDRLGEPLPPGCGVWVVEHRDSWKRVWKTARCLEVSSGPAEGWIRASLAAPP